MITRIAVQAAVIGIVLAVVLCGVALEIARPFTD